MVTYLGQLGINETGVNWSGNTVPVVVELGDRGVHVTLLEDYCLGSNGADAVPLASAGERFSVSSSRGIADESNLVRAIVSPRIDSCPTSCRFKKGDTVMGGYLLTCPDLK